MTTTPSNPRSMRLHGGLVPVPHRIGHPAVVATAMRGRHAAPLVLAETKGLRRPFDLPGAITGTGGIASLVYALSSSATSQDGVSHWGDTKVLVAFAAAAVLLNLARCH